MSVSGPDLPPGAVPAVRARVVSAVAFGGAAALAWGAVMAVGGQSAGVGLGEVAVTSLPWVASAALVGAVAGTVPLSVAVTAALAGYALIAVYEWTHFLIHTAVRPRSRHFRAIHRAHRLHHFKNEHHWHGITTTMADRLLGTAPDAREVERSSTARSLRET